MCQLDWTPEYPDIWLNLISGVSMGVFLDEVNMWISTLSQTGWPPQCGWASFGPLKTWREQMAEWRTLPLCLFSGWHISSLWYSDGTCLCWFSGLGLRLELHLWFSRASSVQLTGLLSLSHCVGQSLIINHIYIHLWAIYIYISSIGSASLENPSTVNEVKRSDS